MAMSASPTSTEPIGVSGPVPGESPDGAIADRIRAAQERLDNVLSVFPYILDCAYSYSDVQRLRDTGPDEEGVWVEDVQTGEVAQMFYLEYLTGRDDGLVRRLPNAPDLTDVAIFQPSEATELPATPSSPGAA